MRGPPSVLAGAGGAELSEAWESYHEHGVGGMTDAERRAVFDEIKERSQSEPLTGADEDFLRHFEEFLDEALGIGGKAANRWSGEARAAALEARRAKARAEGGGGNPVVKGGGNASDVTPPPAMMKQDPNMPKGGYPETARFWPVKNMPGMHIVLLKPGDVPYPISERMAEKFESFRFNHGLWVRKPGTFKWAFVGLEDGRDTGMGQVHQDYGRR